MKWLLVMVVCAVLGFLFAAFFWPWCGPLLLSPCPLFTRAGVVVVVVLCALAGSWPYPVRPWRKS